MVRKEQLLGVAYWKPDQEFATMTGETLIVDATDTVIDVEVKVVILEVL